jgi:protocatechuate 4,5-dioxygenase beta chain
MPSRVVAGIGLSHVPSVGPVVDRKRENDPAWKPLFDAYVPVRSWLKKLQPDVAIVVYNDHVAEFTFDKYPTFALGAADRYAIADEGFGTRPLPEVPGDAGLSIHLCERLMEDEFDLTVCQEMGVEHGFLVPMNLCFPHTVDREGKAGWPVKTVPLQVNVIQHPLPTARRCFRLGQALRRAVESYAADLKIVILGTGGMSHQLQGKRFGFMSEQFDRWFLDELERNPEELARISHHKIMQEAGAEAVELIMWLTMRGALSPGAKRVHRHYYAPMTTGMGLITFEELGLDP